MRTEKQRAFLIWICYVGVLLALFYFFFEYILPSCFPFFAGFAIAFFMRPLIRRLHHLFGIHERLLSFLFILLFYLLLFLLLGYGILKLYLFLSQWIQHASAWYEDLLPYLSAPRSEQVLAALDNDTLSAFLRSLWEGILSSFASFAKEMASSLLQLFQHMLSHLPGFLFSFFMTIFSSFLFQMDYGKITAFILHQLPKEKREVLFASSRYVKQTFLHLAKANLLLMLCTFFQLVLGFLLLPVPHPFLAASLISLFDAMPLLGTGGVMIPWIVLSLLQQQSKLACGLLIVYLIVICTRSILEPKIMGKQLGLHPLIMLICMYIGGKIFGFLGFLLLPNVLMLLRCLHDGGYIRLYR